MTSFFHAYDLRGRFPDEIGLEEAERVGKAYGTFIEAGKVLVARDGREHGEKVAEAFIDGITSTGTDVVFAGMVPSPVVYFGQVELGLGSCAVVTASHNPPEYTGFKFCKEDALAMSRDGGMREMQEIYEDGDFETAREQGEVERVDLVEDYVDFVSGKIDLERGLELAVNFGNGVSGPAGRKMLEALGCSVKGVNEEVDGSFPNHLPAPAEEEAQEQLKQAMEGEDLGILFDGDGDRAGFILPGYGRIDGDELIAILAGECLEERRGRVFHDLRASKLVPEKIREHGGEPEVTRVGHTFFSEIIHREEDVVFAGELSGHFYFPVFDIPWDDGLFTAALVCRVVAERDLVSELEQFPDYPVSPELRIDCPHEAKEKVVDRIAEKYSDHEISTVDGVKVEFDRGWALVRPSNTEEKMSVRAEADTEEALEEILEDVESNVREFIAEVS